MTYEEIKNRIDELKKIIKENNEYYYLYDAPKITDFEYDELFREYLDTVEYKIKITPKTREQRVL